MPTLLIGNTRTAEMVGDLAALTPEEREAGSRSALRLLWFAEPGDVVVLPFQPRAEYLAYITSLIDADPDSITVLVPPPGALGTDLLTPDRTADPDFRRRLATVVRERSIDRVLAGYKDVPITQLASSVGLTVPGHAFSAQGGDALLNSKAGFRAIAAGTMTPIAEGLVTNRQEEARELVTELFAAGHSVIVKREFCAGGLGNEILSPAAGVPVAGAPTAVVLADPQAVADHFARRWDWLTEGGRYRVVIERYLADCATVYAEYLIGDDGPELVGVGEMVMSPVVVGEIVPGRAGPATVRAALLAAGSRLCSAAHALGYRGYFSTDAVLTPAGEVFVTETNARLSGSTYLHEVILRRMLATAHHGRRVLLEMYWRVPSIASAMERLTAAGLVFSRATGIGVMLASELAPDQTVICCLLAEDLPSAWELARQMNLLFDEPQAGLFTEPQTGPVTDGMPRLTEPQDSEMSDA